MSVWDDLEAKAKQAINKYDTEKLQVFIKTDLGKEVLVYDATQPAVNEKGGEAFIKYGIKIRNADTGEVIGKFNEYPKTNFIKLAGVSAVLLTGLYIGIRGIRKAL